jgi:glutamine amidotransferase
MAHVRATSLATVQETNCHPFRYKNWLFVHNGEVFEIEKFRKELLMSVAPEYFGNIMGTTDSEVMFHLALTFGLEKDPLGAIAKMAGFIEKTARKNDVAETLWMTLGISDGKTLYAYRYASDGAAPTLYYSPDPEELFKLNPAAREMIGSKARAIVSEPIGINKEAWKEIPQGALVIVRDGEVKVDKFTPVES